MRIRRNVHSEQPNLEDRVCTPLLILVILQVLRMREFLAFRSNF